jgi:hypothetical protein
MQTRKIRRNCGHRHFYRRPSAVVCDIIAQQNRYIRIFRICCRDDLSDLLFSNGVRSAMNVRNGNDLQPVERWVPVFNLYFRVIYDKAVRLNEI